MRPSYPRTPLGIHFGKPFFCLPFVLPLHFMCEIVLIAKCYVVSHTADLSVFYFSPRFGSIIFDLYILANMSTLE
jgi:hypothetical protein